MKKIFLIAFISIGLFAQTEKECKTHSYLGEFCKEITFEMKNGKKNISKVKNFQDGMLLEEVNMLNGVKHGESIVYNKYAQDKQITQIHTYKNGKKNGIEKTFHMNGKVKSKLNYKNDLADGPYKGYNKKGDLIAEANFKNGKKNGIEKIYYNMPGKLMKETTYINGIKNGFEKYYYLQGQLKEEINYKNSIKHGKYMNYYNNKLDSYDGDATGDGTKKAEWTETVEYNNGKENGVWLRKYADGKIKEKANFKNGKLFGSSESYYENGQKKLIGNFDNNGNRNGKWLEYYDTGKQKNIYEYQNGKLSNQIRFTPDGTQIN